MLGKIKHLWASNPVLLLVAVALLLALVSLVWGTLIKGLSYVRDSARGIGSNFTRDEAQALANSIYQEIHSMFTNEDNIVDALIPLKLADYYKVKAEFGIQRYNATLDEFNFTGEDRNLTEILNLTLSDDDKEKIKGQNPWLPIG